MFRSVPTTLEGVPPHAAAGTVLAGRYRLIRLLGCGSLGETHLAVRADAPSPPAHVVVKILHRERDAEITPAGLAAAAAMAHPNLAPILDSGLDEKSGRRFLVLPWLDSVDWLAAARLAAPQDVPALLAPVCRGLVHLHEHGRCHGRLHGGNARVLRRSGESLPAVVLCDFGLPEAGGEKGILGDFRRLGWMLLRALAPEAVLPAHDSAPPAEVDAILSQHVDCGSAALGYVIRRCLEIGGEASFRSAVEILDEVNRRAGLDLAIHPPELRRSLVFDGRLVGRQAQMERLKVRLESLVGGGLGVHVAPLAVVLGESGIGKSRLLRELLAHARKKRVLILEGACREGARHPYAALEAVVRTLADALQERRSKEGLESDPIHPGIVKHGPELAKICPELGRRLGLPPSPCLEPEQEKMRLIDQVAYFIHDASRHAPILIALEDLHWTDEGTLDFLAYLCRSAHGGSVHVLATARREEVPGSPLRRHIDEGSGEGWLEQALLERLGEPDLVRLAGDVLGFHETAHKPALEKVAHEAEGNPYQLQEILCHMAEEGFLAREDGKWKIDTRRLDQIRLPAHVAQAFLGRVQRLDPGEIHLLRLLAVLGRSAGAEQLARMLERPRWEIQRQVEALADRAILERQTSGTFPLYGFRHARQAEALYAAIPEADRVALHGRVAIELKSQDTSGDLSERAALARHLLAAGCVAEALQVGIPVIDDLTKRCSFKEALTLATLLESYREIKIQDCIRLLNRRAMCHARLKNLDSARDLFDQAHSLAEEHKLSAESAAALSGLTYLGLWAKDPEARERGEQAARKAYRILLSLQSDSALKELMNQWAGYFLENRRLHIAERMLKRAACLNEHEPLDSLAATNLLNRGIVANLRGRLTTARHLLEDAVAISQRSNDVYLTIIELANLVHVANLAGDFKLARSYFSGPEIAVHHQGSLFEGHLEACWGKTLAGQGELGQALSVFRRLLLPGTVVYQTQLFAACRLALADLCLLIGKPKEAGDILTELDALGIVNLVGDHEFKRNITQARLEATLSRQDHSREILEACHADAVKRGHLRHEAESLIEMVFLLDGTSAAGGLEAIAERIWKLASDAECATEYIVARISKARVLARAGAIANAREALEEAFGEAERKEAGVLALRVLNDQVQLAERAGELRSITNLRKIAHERVRGMVQGMEQPDDREAFLRSSLAIVAQCESEIDLSNHESANLGVEGRQSGDSVQESLSVAADPLIVGTSSSIRNVLAKVAVAARGNVFVLINGESGTGKELVAKRIHSLSGRSSRPFLAVDCGAVPENLVESELFGHRKGAFTGADRDKAGIFEEASGGTLLLDEIGNASPNFQAKLLRVLQEREVRRVGENRARPVDVRVIAATNADLRKEVDGGRFREDLLYRLSVMTIEMPPLRERMVDIPLLATAFLGQMKKAGQKIGALDRDALQALMAHAWPGNVRELQNALQAAALAADGGSILPEHLPDSVRQAGRDSAPPAQTGPSSGKIVNEDEKQRILDVLRQTRGDKTAACRLLGWNRMKLYRRLRLHEIPREFGKPNLS